jgi:hypothetical protein
MFLAAKTDDEEAQAWVRAFDGGKLSRDRGAHWIRGLPLGGPAVTREDKGG